MAAETYIYDVSKSLLDCIYDRLVELGLPLPCRVCVVPGAIAYDSCEGGGQLVVSATQEYVSEQFPTPATDISSNSGCSAPYLVVEFLFSLIRCAPTPTGLDTTVSCEALDETAILIGKDAYAMRTALKCCLEALLDTHFIVDYTMSPIVKVGPQGGCVGNEVRVRVGFTWLG
jgi:hypothetical protein